MSSTTKIILALVVIIGAGAVYFMTRPASDKAATDGANASAPQGRGRGAGSARTVTVETVESRMGRIRERVLLTGALKPKEQVDVTPKTAGRVIKILVNVGDTVKRNMLIAEMEDDELQQQVSRAKAVISVAAASLSQRESELANSKLSVERAQTLLNDGLIPRQQFESESTALRVLQAQVQLAEAQQRQAEAELRELNIRLDQAKIYAPIDGQVADRFVDMGALVGPSTPLVRIVNIATLVTATSVSEGDVGKMRIGGAANVRVDAMPNETFVGRIARISPVLDPATRSANVEIEIPNPGMALRAEMFVRVDMNLESTREAVLVPRESLVYRGDSSGVYVVEEGKQVFRYVETGLTQDDDVEIAGNLSSGTVVIAKGASMLREGDSIQIVAGPKGPGDGKGSRAEAPEGKKSSGKSRPAEGAANPAEVSGPVGAASQPVRVATAAR